MRTIKLLFIAAALLFSSMLSMGQNNSYRIIYNGKNKGIADPSGKMIAPAKYQDINNSYDNNITPDMGYFRVKIKDKVGLVNIKGEEIIPPTYDYISTFSDSLAVALLKDDLYILNTEGKIINNIKLKTKNRQVASFKHGIAFVVPKVGEDGDIDIISPNALLGTVPKFKYFGSIAAITNKYFMLKDRGVFSYYGLYDVTGKPRSNNYYSKIEAPDEQNYFYATKYTDKKTYYGYINDNFKEVIPFSTEYIGRFNKAGYTNKGGNTIIDRHNNIVRKIGIDTIIYTIDNSKYYTYYLRKNAYLCGVMNDKFQPITPTIFVPSGNFKAIGDKELAYKPGTTTFRIDEKGIVHPQNIAHEYEALPRLIPYYHTADRWNNLNTMLQLAVDKKYPPALKFRDSLYSDSVYLAQNKQVADPNLEKKAIAGNVNSMYEVGKAYLNGISGYAKNPEKGVQWLQQAINKNHQQAAYELVYHYIKNHEEAKAQQFLNSYKGPRNSGPYGLEDLYAPGGLQLALAKYSTNNEQQQETYYTRAINSGNANASFEYGLKLLHKEGDKYQKGLKLLTNNALQGNVKSMLTLGNHFGIYSTNPSKINRNSSNQYYNMVMASNKASIYDKQEAKTGLFENNKPEPLAVGTILNIDDQKKAIVFRDAYGFRTHDNKYYVSANSNYNDYKNYNIIKGASGTKACNSCNGTGKTNKQVVDGSYTTKDVTYKTGSTVSGDYKVTTTKTHNTYKSVQEKCLVCNGHGIVFSK